MDSSLKPVIKLWDAVGLGLIINYPSGVLISNQTGGSACLQPSIEGIYMPLGNDCTISTHQLISPEIELSKYFTGNKYATTGATNGLDTQDTEHITAILTKFNLHGFITVDVSKIGQSHEAWVYVNIHTCNGNGLLSNFDPNLNGVLTWNNSD